MLKFLALFVMHELVDFFLCSWINEGEYVTVPLITMTGIKIL